MIGAATLGVAGAAVLDAVGGTAAADATISTGERQLLRDFFGQGLKGARARAESFEIPKGLTRETLQKYAKVAQNAIDRGIDKTGVQAERLKLIERAMDQLK